MPLQINMSLPNENPESRRCLHVCTFMTVVHMRSILQVSIKTC
jgi:hypothetical protein